MDDDLEIVQSCLDDIVLKGLAATPLDIAKAMQCFVRVYSAHTTETHEGIRQVNELIAQLKPIVAWIEPRMKEEAIWAAQKQQIKTHVLMWLAVILLGSIGVFILNAARSALLLWLAK